jgi:ketosteroid isomerase-like protein
MSQENVEVLRSFYRLMHETGRMPTELFDSEVEIHMFNGSPISGPYRGHDGLRDWQRDTFDVINEWRIELDDLIVGEDPDVIVAMQRFVGRLAHTDLVADFPLTVIVRFRDGLIVRFQGYREPGEALKAVGLEE